MPKKNAKNRMFISETVIFLWFFKVFNSESADFEKNAFKDFIIFEDQTTLKNIFLDIWPTLNCQVENQLPGRTSHEVCKMLNLFYSHKENVTKISKKRHNKGSVKLVSIFLGKF